MASSFVFAWAMGSVRHGPVVELVGMAVDDHVQPGQLADNRIASVLRGDGIVVAQMGNQYHVVRPGNAHLVDGLLEPFSQPVSGIIGQKVVHRLSDLVQDILNDGFRKGIRDHNAHETDLHIPGLKYAPGTEYGFSVGGAVIDAGIATVQLLCAFRKRLAVVKLMVPRHCQVVADAVHHFDDFNALGNGPDRRALYGVSRVDKQHMIVLRLQLLFIQGQPIVADILLEGHVHVVGMQDHRCDLGRVSSQPVLTRKGRCAKQQDSDQYR